MARSALGKVAWVGRTASMVFGLALVLALLFGVATMALAAVPGDPFRLGQTNGIDTMSTLVGNVAGTMLRVDNNSTGAGATALELRVEAGKPPMKVNSATKVAQLNADKVDGKHATAFYAAGSKVADSSHADTADSAATAQEADHAVTADSATSADSAADAATLEGKSATDFAAAYKRTVVASPVGTDTENGQALLDALSGITDASSAKPYLLYVEPGTYDLGTRALSMKQHVDIQGAGERKTLITGDVAASSCQHATVVGANDAELRFLTARNTSGSATTCTIAIYYPFATSSHLTNVTAEATGVGGDLNMGVYGESESNLALTNVTATASGATEANYGVRNDPNVSMTMFNVTAAASGGANRNYGTASETTGSHGGMSMIDVTSTASGGDVTNVGVRSREPTITIRHSKLSGSTNSLNHGGRGGQVALSQLVGPVSSELRCFNNYDENMEAVSCP
jgi:hypothetical protein